MSNELSYFKNHLEILYINCFQGVLHIKVWEDLDEGLNEEKEADEFASKWLLSSEQENEILSNEVLSYEDVINYAKKFNTHPATIVGILQHRRIIEHSVGNDLIEKVDLNKD